MKPFTVVITVLLAICLLGGCSAPQDDKTAFTQTAKRTCSDTNYSPPSADPGYRAVVNVANNAYVNFPSASSNWQVEYQYTTPELPCYPTWNFNKETFYIWGDIDFDQYGANGPFKLSNYMFNQITPQLMTGWALASSNSSFIPSWSFLDTYVIQAQYFWMSSSGTPYAQTGPVVNVNPGDVLTTTISYNATSGSITASISAPEGTSSIQIARPFPNENPPLFTNWTQFFQSASAKSSGQILAHPAANVESHYVDGPTLCSVLPLVFQSISVPGVNARASSYSISQIGAYSCSGPLATLNF